MFLQMCVCPQRGVSAPGGRGVCSWGVSAPGGMPGPRGVSAPGVSVPGGGCLLWGGVPGPGKRGVVVSQHALRQTPGRDGHCCGRYASYWNAFLFCVVMLS